MFQEIGVQIPFLKTRVPPQEKSDEEFLLRVSLSKPAVRVPSQDDVGVVSAQEKASSS